MLVVIVTFVPSEMDVRHFQQPNKQKSTNGSVLFQFYHPVVTPLFFFSPWGGKEKFFVTFFQSIIKNKLRKIRRRRREKKKVVVRVGGGRGEGKREGEGIWGCNIDRLSIRNFFLIIIIIIITNF